MTLVVLAAGWIAGILLGLETDAGVPALVLFSVAAAALAGLLKIRGLSPWPALVALVLLIGVIRVQVSEGTPPLKDLASFRNLVIQGVVATEPEAAGAGVEFVLSLDGIDLGDGLEDASGKVRVVARPTADLVQAREEPYFRYGDRLELAGRLEEPEDLGDFDYRAYMANQGIHLSMAFPKTIRLLGEGEGNPALDRLHRWRREASEGIDRALPEPQASLAQALLLGRRGRLPEDIVENFRSSGTSHLLAISGLHVGVVLALSLGVAAWLMGRRRQLYLLPPLFAIWLYALLGGFSSSLERAAIMGTVLLLGLAVGRPRSMLPALAIAAGFMAGVDPPVLKQISFQLSFTAMAGIAFLLEREPPPWRQLMTYPAAGAAWWRVPARALAVALAVSVAATVATLPLIAFNFHRIPTVGIPATILALPALPPLLVASAVVAGIAGMVHSSAGQVLGWFAWVPLEYVLRLVDLFSRVPGSTISVPRFSGLFVWAYYVTLALVLVFPGGPSGLWVNTTRTISAVRGVAQRNIVGVPKLRMPGAAYLSVALGLALLASLLWFRVVSGTGTDGRLHVHFLDVGQGDSVLIVTPEGTQVLVDGGPDAIGAARTVANKAGFLDRDLDMVVLTHPDEDHLRGLLEVVERYSVDMVLEGDSGSEDPLYQEWLRVLDREKTPRVTAFRGQTILLDGSTWMQVLNPSPRPIVGTSSDANNNALVLRLVYGEIEFMLTADIEAEAERLLLRAGVPLRSDVLKVAHHGSATSTTPRFLSAVSPAVEVISAGPDNRFGHPRPEVISRLDASLGSGRTYSTAERGDIELITDGSRLWIKTSQ